MLTPQSNIKLVPAKPIIELEPKVKVTENEPVYDYLVNRSIKNESLETKSRINGFTFTIPVKDKDGNPIVFDTPVPYKNSKGVLDETGRYTITSLITINDFDGPKETIKIVYFEGDGSIWKDPQIGVYKKFLASNYHGKLSANYKKSKGKGNDFINELRNGYTIAPGLYDAKKDPRGSQKSRGSFVHTQFILFDGDKWTNECPAPKDINELFNRFPYLYKTYSMSESVSSLAPDNPIPKLRIGVILPSIITAITQLKQIALFYKEHLPFIDEKVGNDIVRLSYGNGRANAFYECFGNVMPKYDFNEALNRAENSIKITEQFAKKAEEKKKEEVKLETYEKAFVETGELEPVHDYRGTDPVKCFINNVDIRKELRLVPELTELDDDSYHYTGGSNERSIKYYEADKRLTFFSSSAQALLPKGFDRSMDARYWLLYKKYGINYLSASVIEIENLKSKLADAGYGTFTPAAFINKRKEDIKKIAKQKGKIVNEFDYEIGIPERIINEAPIVDDLEEPSFKKFSVEERKLIINMGMDPDAGFYINKETKKKVPRWTTRYSNLESFTNSFKMNGEPEECHKNRIYSTLKDITPCSSCGGSKITFIDRAQLTGCNLCEKCHKEEVVVRYLDIELRRSLTNTIKCDSDEKYLQNDPAVKDFELWTPGQLCALRAAMRVGKTTWILEEGIRLAKEENRHLILVVPRVSLAKSIYYGLTNKRFSNKDWGLYHEGVEKEFRRPGRLGTICCLPSLIGVMRDLEGNQTRPDDEYIFLLKNNKPLIAIDENDFTYQLLTLVPSQSRVIKEILKKVCKENGLVIAGQTETTAGIEAFAEEIEAEETIGIEKRGWYDKRHKVNVVEYPEETSELQMISELETKIMDSIENGQRVYCFVTLRRNAQLLGKALSEFNPVLYTGYSKGDPRAQYVLRKQQLPEDSKLFIGTGAASVGINLRDKKAKTIVFCEVLFGQRQMSDNVQKACRERENLDIEILIKNKNPQRVYGQVDLINKTLFREDMKLPGIERKNNFYRSEAGIKKMTTALVINKLADEQPIPYIKYQLKDVANIDVDASDGIITSEKEDIVFLKKIKDTINKREKNAVLGRALELLENKEFYPSSDIRKKGAQGLITTIEQLAREEVNGILNCLGWKDSYFEYKDGEFSVNEDAFILQDEVIELAKEFIGYDDLKDVMKTRNKRQINNYYRGYGLLHYSEEFTSKYYTNLQSTLIEGEKELVNVVDDRFSVCFLKELIETIKEEKREITKEELVNVIRPVLRKEYKYDKETTYGHLLKRGALGSNYYNEIKGLSNDDILIEFVRKFIERLYPINLKNIKQNRKKKKESLYTLHAVPELEFILRVFECRIKNAESFVIHDKVMPFTEGIKGYKDLQKEKKEQAITLRKEGKTYLEIAQLTGLGYQVVRKINKKTTPRLTALKEEVRLLRSQGVPVETIMEEFDITKASVYRMCDGIKVERSKTKINILKVLEDGAEWKTKELFAVVGGSENSFTKHLKELVNEKTITKIKRGVYKSNL